MIDVHRQSSLPVDALIPEIVASLRQHPNLVIEAEPGAGKTTRVPVALLGAVRGEVLVLEPRRIAARLAAKRVARELDQEIGETVGYQVRFERVAGPATRLHFLTEGVLTRRMLSDPDLRGVDAVVLDEFHERHLESDLALVLLKRLQKQRPELHLIVMSATLDAAGVAKFLDECPVLKARGRLFELSVEYTPYSPAPLEQRTADAVQQLLREGADGDALVFLPGAAEIRRTARACEARALDALVLPLHGDLPAAEQDRAIAPAERRKVILATNVAESSITIDGVRTVIDSGLARHARYSPWTGLPTLEIGRVSKASAQQRAGRAARTGPGRAIRLYTEADFQGRADFETPEILRSDLTQLCLALRAMEIADPRNLKWLDAPPQQALAHAEQLLAQLVTSDAEVARMLRFPLHPRLARMLTAAEDSGAGRAACIAAALVSAGSHLERNDLLEAMEAPMSEATRLQLRHLLRLVHPARREKSDDDTVLQAVLAGFPDRVAQRKTGNQVQMANGMMVEIVGQAPGYPLIVALDVEDRIEKPLPQVRLFARVEPEWLLDQHADRVREETTTEWNRQGERVEAVSRLMYDKIVLTQSSGAQPDQEVAAQLLATAALEVGMERFVDPQELLQLEGRAQFAGVEVSDMQAAFREFCSGYKSFAELKKVGDGFVPWVERQLSAGRLSTDAPLTLRLAGGRQTKVHYEPGKIPWIASRLQDFFGMEETPLLGRAKTPVVVHLLAPNHRAVQVTTDLAGFWTRLYPQVRRELMRRYPRHAWPENPRVAQK
jgi:ATP-dependent helicase HrpB